MKKYLFTAAVLLAAATTHAQRDLNTAADAVRYTQDNITGTARFRAMGGAFGAVGGDMSAININPAGAAIFNFNQGTATVSSYNINNKSNYYGNHTQVNDNSFDLNQVGAVFVFTNANADAFMQKFTLGFDYENNNSFDNSYYLGGTSPNSIDNYFLRYANGVGNEGPIPLSTLNNGNYDNLSFIDQQAYLGYNAFIFNPVSQDDNTTYITNVPQTGSYYQQSRINNTGYNGKIALNFAAQLKQRVYVGANLNVHVTNYINNVTFSEDVNNATTSGLQYVDFYNERYTYGGGFSFDVGGIVKITEQLRAGLAWKSPTWLKLQDEITQSIASYCPECGGTSGNGMNVVNPGMTYILNDYTIKSPGKWTGSLAYIFGKSGLVSVDYAVQDYANTKYTGSAYSAINAELAQTMDVAGELRVGTEWRIKNISLRGGYRYAQSPYKNGTTIGNLTGYSGGIGFNLGSSKLDLAYTWYQRDTNVSLLTPGLVDAARVQTTNNNIVLSYTMDL